MGEQSVHLVVNPRAAAGRAARHAGLLLEALRREGVLAQMHATTRPGEAGAILRKLLLEGAERIGVVGGDGTFHEAFCGLYSEKEEPLPLGNARFALLPCGTGGDLRRTLGLPDDVEKQAKLVLRDKALAIDLGEIALTREDGSEHRRPFVNVASFGISAVVDRLVNEGPKWLGAKIAFVGASLRAGIGWRNVPVRVTVDGEDFCRGPCNVIAVGNGRYFGGGMNITPEASPTDGLLDVVALTDMTQLETTLLAVDLFRGTHLRHKKVLHARGRVIVAEPDSSRDVFLDVDGETPGRLPARFTVRPNAVRVLVP